MKRIDLIKVSYDAKMGEICPYYEPNITEDSIFYEDGNPIGFYIRKMPEKLCKLADIANAEFNSSNVPKMYMDRKPTDGWDEEKQKWKYKNIVKQMSCILGSVPPKPHMRRNYPNKSSVHGVASAQTFIKAMLMLAKESEQVMKEYLPEQYNRQLELFKQVSNQWKFGNLFTSSISNYNISAPYHRDAGNIVGAVNVIITKRTNAKGGNLHIPEYNATIDSADNSMLVYPAWKSMHGVTPIIPTFEGGYRNSLVFYPLKAFVNI